MNGHEATASREKSPRGARRCTVATSPEEGGHGDGSVGGLELGGRAADAAGRSPRVACGPSCAAPSAGRERRCEARVVRWMAESAGNNTSWLKSDDERSG